jgi:hypothetical protein
VTAALATGVIGWPVRAARSWTAESRAFTFDEKSCFDDGEEDLVSDRGTKDEDQTGGDKRVDPLSVRLGD